MPNATRGKGHFVCQPDNRGINEFIRSNRDLFRRIAERNLRYRGLRFQDIEDLVSIVATTAARMYDLACGEMEYGWKAELYVRSHSAIRAYAESSAVDGIAGRTAGKRRERVAAEVVQRRQDVDYTTAIEDHNNYMVIARTDARRQGALLSERDLHAVTVHTLDDGTIAASSMSCIESDRVADLLDASAAIQAVLDEVAARFPKLTPFAAEWLHWTAEGGTPVLTDIAEKYGVVRSTVCRWIADVVQCAQDVCVSEDGSLVALSRKAR